MKLNFTGAGSTKKIFAAMAVCSLLAVSSCTKKADTSNDGAKFVGTWHGTSSCTGASSTLTFAAGSDGNTVTMSGTIGGTGCVKSITLQHKASGSTLTMSSQTFTDLCGNSYTFAGTAVLSGSTLTVSETVSGAINQACTGTYTK